MAIFGRRPKTHQESLALEKAKEYGVKIRAKRMNLPTDWDDKPAASCRSWKRHRVNQYK